MPVYFVQGGKDGPVKIGWANYVSSRLVELQCASPVPLALVRAFDGPRALERALHDVFAAERLHGEWFEHSVLDDLDAVLEAIELQATAISGTEAMRRPPRRAPKGCSALGVTLTELRRARGQRLDEVAATAGVPSSYLRALEAGRRNPGWLFLRALASALGVSVGELAARAEAATRADAVSDAGQPDG